MVEMLNFENKSILPTYDKWTLTNATSANNVLTLQPNGYAQVTIQQEVNTEFKHYKVVSVFESSIADELWNYNSIPSIQIEECYKDDEGKPESVNFKALGFNIVNPSNTQHRDETIIQARNRTLKFLRVRIVNNSSAPLIINTLTINLSIDVSEKQISKVYQQATSNASAKIMNQYYNENGIMNGIGFITSGDAEMKLGFQYFNGRLVAVNTNYGQTVAVYSLVGQIDLSNTEPGYLPPPQPPEPDPTP